MPPALLVDLAGVDMDAVAWDLAAIQERIPQRFEMAFLDRVHLLDLERGIAVGSRDVRDDEFWVRGHFPGRPILPGVLSVESMAQLCSFFYFCRFSAETRIFGFGGVDGVKFRGTVVPGDRLVVICRARELKSRRAIFDAQGVVDGKLVVESVITGVPI